VQIQYEIKNLEEKFEKFSQRVGELKGEYNTLLSQQEKSEKLISQLKEDEDTYSKAVELLTLVQKVTNENIKNYFERIITWALQHIYENDGYKFHLEFGRRGNLGELDFCVLTPEKPEAFDMLKTDSGGTKNIVSFILRLVLMEISNPKINGYIILDEAFKNVNGLQFINNLNSFLLDVNKRFKRQIIHITDMENFKADERYNLIEIK